MPPNSWMDWVVGANVSTARKKKPRAPKRVVNLDWSTDDDEDIVSLRIPHERRRRIKEKQVRFEEPPKLALKKESEDTSAASESEEASTDIATSGEEEESEWELDSDCPCTKCISERRELKRKKRAEKKAELSADDSTDEAAAAAAIHAKHKLKKAAEKAKAERKTKEKKRAYSKGKKGGSKKVEESETSEVSETNNGSEDEPPKKEVKSKKKNEKKQEKEESEATESTAEEAPKEKESKKSKQGKKNKDGESSQKTEKPKADKAEKKSLTEVKGVEMVEPLPKEKKAKKAKLPPFHPPPEMRKPSLLMPINAQVVQVEHAVEQGEDPRPNAFYDHEHGIMRVYHGPTYGNPYSTLYPKRLYNNQPLPIGTPHPSQNPWFAGFPPGNGGARPNVPNMSNAPYMPPGPEYLQNPQNPWFQGYNTVTVGGGQLAAAGGKGGDNNPFRSQYPFDHTPTKRPPGPPKKDKDAGWDSNVFPGTSDQVNKNRTSGPRRGAGSNCGWNAQSGHTAQGPRLSKEQEMQKAADDDVNNFIASLKGSRKESSRPGNLNNDFNSNDWMGMAIAADGAADPWGGNGDATAAGGCVDNSWGGNQNDTANNAEADDWGNTGNSRGAGDWGNNDTANTGGADDWSNNDATNTRGYGWNNSGDITANAGRDDWANTGDTAGGWDQRSNHSKGSCRSNNSAGGGIDNSWGQNNVGGAGSQRGSTRGSTSNNVGPGPQQESKKGSVRSTSNNVGPHTAPGAYPASNAGEIPACRRSNGSNDSNRTVKPLSNAGNVGGDDWGDTGNAAADNTNWGNNPEDVAQDTGGYWDTTEGQKAEHQTHQPQPKW